MTSHVLTDDGRRPGQGDQVEGRDALHPCHNPSCTWPWCDDGGAGCPYAAGGPLALPRAACPCGAIDNARCPGSSSDLCPALTDAGRRAEAVAASSAIDEPIDPRDVLARHRPDTTATATATEPVVNRRPAFGAATIGQALDRALRGLADADGVLAELLHHEPGGSVPDAAWSGLFVLRMAQAHSDALVRHIEAARRLLPTDARADVIPF